MSQPSDASLKDWARTLDGIAFKPLVEKLCEYRRRDQEQAIADGYPGSTLGGGRGGSELTPTEAAAELRLRGQSDPIHDAVCAALDMLQQTVSSAGGVAGLIAKLDKLAGTYEPFIPLCQVCERGGIQHPSAETTSCGGRLPVKLEVCGAAGDYLDRACRDFQREHVGQLPKLEDVLPTIEQIQHHERTGRWKVHVLWSQSHFNPKVAS